MIKHKLFKERRAFKNFKIKDEIHFQMYCILYYNLVPDSKGQRVWN